MVGELFFERFDLGGDAGYEGIGWDSGALFDDGARGHEAEFSDFGVGQ